MKRSPTNGAQVHLVVTMGPRGGIITVECECAFTIEKCQTAPLRLEKEPELVALVREGLKKKEASVTDQLLFEGHFGVLVEVAQHAYQKAIECLRRNKPERLLPNLTLESVRYEWSRPRARLGASYSVRLSFS
jgi:hypothetical protein